MSTATPRLKMPQPDQLQARGQEDDRVICYSGHTYAQEPRAVIWQGQRLPVREVEARWRTPAGPAFWVRTASGARFALSYDDQAGRWSIEHLMADSQPAGNQYETHQHAEEPT